MGVLGNSCVAKYMTRTLNAELDLPGGQQRLSSEDALLQMFVPKDTAQVKRCHISKSEPLAGINGRTITFP